MKFYKWHFRVLVLAFLQKTRVEFRAIVENKKKAALYVVMNGGEKWTLINSDRSFNDNERYSHPSLMRYMKLRVIYLLMLTIINQRMEEIFKSF